MIKNNLEDFLRNPEDLEIEIDDNEVSELNLSNISPQTPFRSFENIKLCAIDPRTKYKIQDLLKQCNDDIAKIKRIINHHY